MAQTDIPQKTKIIMTIAALFMPVFLILPFFFWGGEDDSITIDKELQASRLAPVGQLTVGAPAPAGGAADAAGAAATPGFDAKGEYDKICAACHGSGLMGAPKFGDTAAWQARLDKHGSLDALVKQGIQGLGSMPPKGGAGISDDQFHDVVVYLLENANIPQGGSSAAAPAAGDSAAAPAAESKTEPPAVADNSAAASATENKTEAPAAEAKTEVAAAGGASAQRDPNFNPQGEYDKLCATCHAIGLMNAPKLGDSAAWKERLDKAGGLDGLVQQGIKGINAMPPKGGSTVNDDQFHDLVVFFLDKSDVAH
ncbi:c-type cytochrome [Cardiobacterium hominis]